MFMEEQESKKKKKRRIVKTDVGESGGVGEESESMGGLWAHCKDSDGGRKPNC